MILSVFLGSPASDARKKHIGRINQEAPGIMGYPECNS